MRRRVLVVVAATLALGVPAPAVAAPAFTSTIALVSPGELWASWRPGCPVGPDQLRRVTVSHWGFDGAVHQGQLIVHADLAGELAAVMRDLFHQGFAIERMVPVDAYGGSDDASMDANNTSAFNCRPVTGGTAWSEHAYGRAIDVNPVQNPYVRGSTVLPPAGRAHLDRSTPAQGKIRAGDGVVQAFGARGWSWGGYWSSPRDYQHFERAGVPFRPLPANTGAGIASPAPSRLDVVARSTSSEVVHRVRTAGTWSAARSLGGLADSTPDTTSWGAGRLDVVALGRDGAIWHGGDVDGSWSGWSSLGGLARSGPAVVSWGPNRVDVFVRGMDDALWVNAWTGSAWTGWQSLGGVLTSDPDVASWAAGRLDVFVRGTDGAVWHRGFAAGTWWPWESIGGLAASGPGAASRTVGTVDVFARGTDGALYGNAWTGSGWVGWYALGGLLSSDPDAAASDDGTLTVAASGIDGNLWARTWAGAWGGWQPVG